MTSTLKHKTEIKKNMNMNLKNEFAQSLKRYAFNKISKLSVMVIPVRHTNQCKVNNEMITVHGKLILIILGIIEWLSFLLV